ncbi:MAG TPA: DUF1990 family protein, partial [Chthoniobacterales bacterium]
MSYHPIGLAKDPPAKYKCDTESAVIGEGEFTFARARQALSEWRHFELGWVELYPRRASIEPGTVVAVLVHHFGLWSLNGCRIVYSVGDKQSSCGFAYGTL